jgi:polyhydroxyalkanoate synthase
VSGLPDARQQAEAARFEVGRDVAVTPGQVVLRNRLIELIRYDPQTPQVHPEPLLIVPSWIMKYYILDLSPSNSLVRYLVGQGHTVYMLSWRNPGPEDSELTMDDYLQAGVFDALAAVGRLHGPEAAGARHGLLPGRHAAGHRRRSAGAQGRPYATRAAAGVAHAAGRADRLLRAR